MPEMELGATADPRALVLGDPDALAVTGRRLADLAGAFGRTADGLAQIEVGRWQGAAADAFRSRFPQAVDRFSTAHDAFGHAYAGWERYRQVVAWAQDRATEAVARYQAALAASQAAQDARAGDVARYDAARDAAAAGQGAEPAPLRPFVDPGPGGMAEARALLDAARARRDGVAAEVAEVLRASATTAPDAPSGWDAFVDDVGDMWRSRLDEAGRFLSGVGEGAEALVRTARSLNPLDPWNITHPGQYTAGVSASAAGVVSSAVHPARLVKDVIGTGWGSDPAAAAGRLTPTVALAVLTGGAATSGRAAVEGAVDRAAVTDGVATAPKALRPVSPYGPPTGGARPAFPSGLPTGRPPAAAPFTPTPGGADIATATSPLRPSAADRSGEAGAPGSGPAAGRAAARPAAAAEPGTAPGGGLPSAAPVVPDTAAGAAADLAAADDALAQRLSVLALRRSIIEALTPRPVPPLDLPPGLGPVKFVAPVPRVASDGPAPVSSVPVRDAAGRPVVPAGFADRKAFEAFGRTLHDGVTAAGYDNVRIFVNGSAVSGVKYTTGVPFDLGRTSDFDVALASRRLYDRAKDLGIDVRGDPARTIPLKGEDVEKLELTALQQRLSAAAGRKVEFMVYSSAGGATSRGASIEVGP